MSMTEKEATGFIFSVSTTKNEIIRKLGQRVKQNNWKEHNSCSIEERAKLLSNQKRTSYFYIKKSHAKKYTSLTDSSV